MNLKFTARELTKALKQLVDDTVTSTLRRTDQSASLPVEQGLARLTTSGIEIRDVPTNWNGRS